MDAQPAQNEPSRMGMLFVPTIRAAMVNGGQTRRCLPTLNLLNLIYRIVILNVINIGNLLGKPSRVGMLFMPTIRAYRVVILNVINIGNLFGKAFNFISRKEVRK
jgi:ABC-type polysaccharide transport system permease subunit